MNTLPEETLIDLACALAATPQDDIYRLAGTKIGSATITGFRWGDEDSRLMPAGDRGIVVIRQLGAAPSELHNIKFQYHQDGVELESSDQ